MHRSQILWKRPGYVFTIYPGEILLVVMPNICYPIIKEEIPFYKQIFAERSFIMNQNKRKWCLLLLATLLAASLLSGCSINTVTVLKEDCSGSMEQTVSLPETVWDLFITEFGNEDAVLSYLRTLYPDLTYTVADGVSTDGTRSKVIQMHADFKNAEEFNRVMASEEMKSVTFNPRYFARARVYMPIKGEEEDSLADELAALFDQNPDLLATITDELAHMEMQMSFTFPYTVTETNGMRQEDGKTVIWDAAHLSGERMYALFSEQNSPNSPVFNGAKNGKSYNTGVTLLIASENMLDTVKVNGDTTLSDYLFLSDEGTYRVTATDQNGNNSSINFRIDITKPAVSGVANGKTYKNARTIKFSDTGSGIKKASLNGKTVKSGQKITKKGSYTLAVTDKAGNKKTVKFKIK